MLKAALILSALVAVNGFSIYQPLSCDNALDRIFPYNNLVAPLPYSACQPQPYPIQQCRVQQVQAVPSVSCVPASAPQTVCVPAPAQQTVCVPAPATNPSTPPINPNTIITLLTLLANNPSIASNPGPAVPAGLVPALFNLIQGLLTGLLGGPTPSPIPPVLNGTLPLPLNPGAPAPGAPVVPAALVPALSNLLQGLLKGLPGPSPIPSVPNGTLNGTLPPPLNTANPQLEPVQPIPNLPLGTLGAAPTPGALVGTPF